MPMSLHDKLRLYLAEKRATFAEDGITWTDAEGAHLLLAVDGPLAASVIVDGHVRALAMGAKLHVAHVGAASPVATRTAARFQVELLESAQLAAPDDAMPWGAAPLAAEPIVTLAVDGDRMPWHPAPVAMPAPEPLIVARSEPTPDVAHRDDAMPWGDASPLLQAAEAAHVDPIDMLALPWIHEMESGVEELPAGRETRAGAGFRPTQAPSWGLPWPRPAAPADALAIADPKLWNAPQRLMAVREDLDRIGAPSFGAAKPEGSAWLKRVSEFGPL